MSEYYTRLADPTQDWRVALRECRIHWTSSARQLPGAISVLQAINATPELAEVHMDISEQMTQKLAGALKSRGLRLPRASLIAVARLLINAQNAGTELYLRHKGADARLILDEMHVAETTYLAHYLDRVESSKRPPVGKTGQLTPTKHLATSRRSGPVTINRNDRLRLAGIAGHEPSESAVTSRRNTHLTTTLRKRT
jgi:hypothetical protein